MPGGLWRMALSVRIVTSWRRRTGSPSSVAGVASRTRCTSRWRASVPRPSRAAAATSARSTGMCFQLDHARVGPGQQEERLDQLGHVVDRGPRVVDRLVQRGDRLVGVSLQVLQVAAHDGQRGAQLVAGVGRELALAAQRLADRHQCPLGIQRAAGQGQADAPARPPPTRTIRRTCRVV